MVLVCNIQPQKPKTQYWFERHKTKVVFHLTALLQHMPSYLGKVTTGKGLALQHVRGNGWTSGGKSSEI